MPYYVPLSHGVNPKELAIYRESKAAFINYLSPCDFTRVATCCNFNNSIEDEKSIQKLPFFIEKFLKKF